MAKGFIRGVLWGAGISFGVVTLVSIAGTGPVGNDRGTIKAADAAGSNAQLAEAIGSSGNRLALTGAEAPMGNAPLPDTLVDVAAAAFDTAQIPETGLASDLPSAGVPDSSAGQGLAATDTSAPQVAMVAQPALSTPLTEPDLSISTEPAQPLAPTATVPETAFAESETGTDSAPAPVTIEDNTTGQAPSVTDVVAAPVEPELPEVNDNSGVSLADLTQETPAPETNEAVALAPSVQDGVTVPDAPVATPEATAPVTEVATAETPVEAEDAAPQEVAAVEDPLSDAPQPDAMSTIDVALADTSSGQSTRLPVISQEANAPQVVATSDLDLPAKEGNEKPVGDSAAASVVAATEIEDVVTAPVVATTTSVPPAVAEEAAPTVAALSGIGAVSTPDPVATADLTRVEPAAATEEEPQQTAEIKINRLPTLGAASTPATEEPQATEEPVADVPDLTEGEGAAGATAPVKKYAQPFDNSEGKPVMAIVLIDEGTARSDAAIGLPALRQLPYPVSFAVDAGLADAAERMTDYRNEGFEVLAMVNLPEGATATDAEVNLSVALERMPEVVGVLEGVGTGVQTTRDSGRQVAQILSRTGHGFVTQNKGLNTVQKLAARQGVPSGVVFRDFDDQGQSARMIGRVLDQAAFRAGQEGDVILMGRMREETIAALLVWALQDRAGQVALGPVSGALRIQEQ